MIENTRTAGTAAVQRPIVHHLSKEAALIVKNVNGTVEHTCHCESWLHHWRTYSGQRALYCVVRGCVDKPEVGGHVQESGTADENVYVIPLCRACSEKSGQEFEIFEGVNLVSINTGVTCGRQQRQEQSMTGCS